MNSSDSTENGSEDSSLRRRTMLGMLWTAAGMAGGHGLRLASSLILTRLLFPEVFGIMALLMVFVQALQMFSDIGIGPNIIQNERGDESRFLNTAWTVQIVRGGVIWVACALIAAPIAWLYEEPQLRLLLPILGFQALLSGFNSTAVFSANRHLQLGRLTVLDLSVQAFTFLATVLWALLHPEVSALVAGAIFGSAVRMALTHRLIPGYRNRLAWDGSATREIVRFGSWIFMSTALGFLGSQVDRLILPRLLSWEMLGIYTIALMLTNIPDGVATAISGRVIFPAVSQRSDLPRGELRALIARYRWRVLLVVGPGLALLTHVAEPLVYFLYDDRYHEAGWIFSILSLGLWFRILSATISPALLAIGQPRYFAFSAVTRLLLVSGGLPLAYASFGLMGAVVVTTAGPLIEYLVMARGLDRHELATTRQDALATVLWGGSLALLLGLRALFGVLPDILTRAA